MKYKLAIIHNRSTSVCVKIHVLAMYMHVLHVCTLYLPMHECQRILVHLINDFSTTFAF